jgi:hypothetical protein
MIKHLYYKEWLKTRWFIIASAILALGTSVYTYITLPSAISAHGGKSAYLQVFFTYEIQYFDVVKYVPLIIALLIGISQFAPETLNKRIKLTLHLPLNETYSIYMMVLYGFIIIFTIFTFMTVIILGLNSIFFPATITYAVFKTILPWMLGGFTAYFFIAMISMEPVLKFKFFYSLIFFVIVNLYYAGYRMAPLEGLFPELIAIVIVASISILFSSHRFNKGEI